MDNVQAQKKQASIDMERVKVNAVKAKNIFNKVIQTVASVGGVVTSIVGSCCSDEQVKSICQTFDAKTLSSLANNTTEITNSVFEIAGGKDNDGAHLQNIESNSMDLKDNIQKVVAAAPKFKKQEEVVIDGEYREIFDNEETTTRGL